MRNSTTQSSFAVLYGIAEGPGSGKRLRAILLAMGLHQASSPSTADIIIVHSGGIIDLPKEVSSKTVLIIAPSLGRKHRSMILTELEKIAYDMTLSLRTAKFGSWLKLTGWNIWYLATQPKRLRRIWLAHRVQFQNLPRLVAQNVLVISYRNDPWSSYVPVGETSLHPKFQFISLNAAHDDLWLVPERYTMYFQIHEKDASA